MKPFSEYANHNFLVFVIRECSGWCFQLDTFYRFGLYLDWFSRYNVFCEFDVCKCEP